MKPLPTTEEIKDKFSYDPETGVLTHNHSVGGVAKYSEAGTINQKGYRQVCMNKKVFLAHRLIYKLMTGKDPVEVLDHKDGNRCNNRWENLRPATWQENNWNRGNHSETLSLIHI